MWTHEVPCSTSHGKSYFFLCKYKFTRDETWALDLAKWNSLHDVRNSCGSNAIQCTRTINDKTSNNIV